MRFCTLSAYILIGHVFLEKKRALCKVTLLSLSFPWLFKDFLSFIFGGKSCTISDAPSNDFVHTP